MDLCFLYPVTKKALTKSFSRTGTQPYPNEYLFTTFFERVHSLEDFAKALITHGAKGAALLKGSTDAALEEESRRGRTHNTDPTTWVCLDLDKIELDTAGSVGKSTKDLNALLDSIPALREVSHVLQYGASHGFDGRTSAHLFMQLTRPVVSTDLEGWLTMLNIREPALAKHIRLAPSGLHVQWPLDPVPARNTQIIYIAPPSFTGVKDPVSGARIRVVNRKHPMLEVRDIPATVEVKKARRAVLKGLRQDAGLKAPSYRKGPQGTDIICDINAVVSEIVDENDEFVRVNLNGGDSAAYWFWKSDPKLLYSFKSEDEVYDLEALDAKFFTQYVSAAPPNPNVVAHASATAKSEYLAARFDPDRNLFVLGTEARPMPGVFSKDTFKDVIRTMGLNPRTYSPPIANIVYDPHDLGPRFDAKSGRINTFVPSRYMRMEGDRKLKSPPLNTLRLLKSVLGSDEVVHHFVRWFAFVLHSRVAVGTAWLMQGTPGTGKTLLVNDVLVPLLGESNCARAGLSDLADKFNDYLDSKLLLFVDEADLTKVGMTHPLHIKLKAIIANRRIALRRMHRAVTEVENRVNMVMATNTRNALYIAQDDRRFNVGEFAHVPLRAGGVTNIPEFIRCLREELEPFARYLLAQDVSYDEASQVFETESRTQLQDMASSSVEIVTNRLDKGDIEYFATMVSEDNTLPFDVVNAYNSTMRRWINELPQVVARGELMSIYRYHAPKLVREYNGPVSEGRFLSNQGFTARLRMLSGVPQRAFVMKWKPIPDELHNVLKSLFPVTRPMLRPVERN